MLQKIDIDATHNQRDRKYTEADSEPESTRENLIAISLQAQR